MVGKFLCSHAEMQRCFECMPAARRATIINRKNNVALLRHELMPEKIRTAPGVSNNLSVRSPIRVDQHGIFLLRIEVRRLDDAGVELHAIPRLHGEIFHRRKMVVSKLSDFVFVNRADARTVAAVEILAWWRRSVRIGVIESGSVGRKNRAVRAFLFCEPRQASSVERDTVRSEEHTSELQSRLHLVCRLLLEKKKNKQH